MTTKMAETEKSLLKSGFTWRALTGLLYGILVFQPAMIWMNLSTGGTISAAWVTFIIFMEITRLTGKPLTKAESVVILNLAGMSYFATFLDFIYREYFARSEITSGFGITKYIPGWWVPLDESTWLSRTFFQPSWLIPIGLTLLFILFQLVANLALGLLMREIYVVQEKLPFPMQQVGAEGISILVQREERGMDVFVISAGFASLYALILYAPTLLLRTLGYPAPAAPIPWADLSTGIQSVLPGASFGIATDLLFFVGGFIIPFTVVVNIFIGSAIIGIIGNYVLVSRGITQFANEYYYGMPISQMMYRSHLYAWAGPLVGVAIAAGIFPIIHRYKLFMQGIKSLTGGRATRAEGTHEKPILSLPVLLAVWLGASLASVFVVYYLFPGIGVAFLILMLAFSIGWSLFWVLVNSRALGITGIEITPPGTLLPIAKYSYISMLPQARYDVWFIDPVISTGGASWCATFKFLDLVGCTVKSYLKTYFLMLPITLISAFLYVQIFWWMAPMPSVSYPNTSNYWNLNVVNQNLWMTGKIFTAFDTLWTVSAFIITGAAYFVGVITRLPVSVIGLAAGANTAIPVAFTMLIGGIFGQIMNKRFGKTWGQSRMAVAAGISLGSSIVITVLSTAGMLAKSLWAIPY